MSRSSISSDGSSEADPTPKADTARRRISIQRATSSSRVAAFGMGEPRRKLSSFLAQNKTGTPLAKSLHRDDSDRHLLVSKRNSSGKRKSKRSSEDGPRRQTILDAREKKKRSSGGNVVSDVVHLENGETVFTHEDEMEKEAKHLTAMLHWSHATSVDVETVQKKFSSERLQPNFRRHSLANHQGQYEQHMCNRSSFV